MPASGTWNDRLGAHDEPSFACALGGSESYLLLFMKESNWYPVKINKRRHMQMVEICFQKALPYHIYTLTWNWLWDLGRRTAFSLRIISWQVCFVFCTILRPSIGKKICQVAKYCKADSFCKADSCETDIADNLMNFLGFIVCRQQLFSIWQVDSDRISLHWDWICRHSCVFKIEITTLQALLLMNGEQWDMRKGMFVNLSM